MAKQVYCNNCGVVSEAGLKGSTWITFVLLLFYIVPGIIYMIWRRTGTGQCRACGSSNVVPCNSPMAQQQLQRTQVPSPQPIQMPPTQVPQQPQPQPVAQPEPEPVEQYAIDRPINGGLIEFYKLQNWYNAVFDDEQKYRLEQQFGDDNGNKLASGGVRYKFANVDVLQFFSFWLDKLKAKKFDDVRPLIDDQFKHEASKFCAIDDERWDNEKYYKNWFALMKNRIDALNRLKSNNYFTKATFNPVKDDYTTQPCLDIAQQTFNIYNGELDRAFDQHFAQPIEGCRCNVKGCK